MNNKPELLLPAGNTESFFAAMQAGADAVYLGLSQFNARARASNFSLFQYISLLNEARKKKVLVYVTLNTVIKNAEIGDIIDCLYFLQEANTDGIIIQDWGVYFLAKNYFPKLKIHASTQMGIHNSQGMRFLAEKSFTRAVLARELTIKELEKIVKTPHIETEVFVHGALCYSFSGMCLFSSYTGGRGANRGMCAQPCRRLYNDESKAKFLFNMKDNQLLEYLPKLANMGVASLKVEGRMKNAEYVFKVGTAYRIALDGEEQQDVANNMLQWDFGRQKTAWFAGSDVKLAIAQESDTGVYLGKIAKVAGKQFFIQTDVPVDKKYRLRIVSLTKPEPIYIIVQHVKKEGDGCWIECDNYSVQAGNRVYITKMQDLKFRNTLDKNNNATFNPINPGVKNKILKSLVSNKAQNTEKLYFRIGTPEWMKLINFNEIDGLFISFSKQVFSTLDFTDEFFQQNSDKIFIELPKFIAESSITYYTRLIEKMIKAGIRNFVISQLSQKLMIPEGCRIITNENVYVFNDAAATCIQNEGIESFIYPFEIDFETLDSMQNKSGIVPVYFYPELFYSRMPIDLKSDGTFTGDDDKTQYRRYRKNGVTIVVPDRAVSILQHKNRLVQKGFRNFLIDVSYDIFSKNRLKTLKTRFLKSEQIQPSTTFNFTKGLV